jgi:putative ABC transport system substrate-binding protein
VLIAQAPLSLVSLQQKTRSIPIVFLLVPDPVEHGFVASMARPGANITGFTHFESAMGGKWLGLLKEVDPRVSRVLSIHPVEAQYLVYLDAIKAAAPSFGMQVTVADVRDAADIESAVVSFAREQHGGLIAPPSLIVGLQRRLVVALAARYRLPAVYPYRYFASDGGLMSYGVDLLDLFRRSASYLDRILKGEKPADLPVQQATKYELVINLRTAKALGITVPPTLLVQADEVIE